MTPTLSRFFHCSSSRLGNGSVIEPGNWGRILQLAGWGHNLAFREVALEHVRQTAFPNKPSRLASVFFFDQEDEALFYASSDGRQITMLTYEVEPPDPKAIRHEGDWRAVNPRGPLGLQWAHDYWSGQMQPPPQNNPNITCRELVAVTALKVLRRL